MRDGGFNLGGEQSGHIVMTDHATTGDGLLAGLQFMAAMVETNKPASALSKSFDVVPQRLENVKYSLGADPLTEPNVKKAIADAEARVVGRGRVLIRRSGTEPLIRVMAECDDEALLGAVIDQIAGEIRKSVA